MSGTQFIFPVTGADYSLGVVPPNIPGLQVEAYFGTDSVGQTGNLVPGGPALAAVGAGPTYASGYATFNPGGVLGALDTTLQRTSALIVSGWTMMFTADVGASAVRCAVASDGSTGTFVASLNSSSTITSGAGLLLGINANAPTSGTSLPVASVALMKMYALIWPGNGSPFSIYDLSDSVSGVTASGVTMVANSNTMKIGAYASGTTSSNAANVGYWLFASGVVSLPVVTQKYLSVRGILRTRGSIFSSV